MKKIFGIFITTLLFVTIFSGLGEANNIVVSDKIDQEQPSHDINTFVIDEAFRAQSFVPTKNKLTRIELFICREGSINSDFVVSIRDNLHGTDLATATKQANQIPYGTVSQDWIEFDFPDIKVTSGNTYYFICTTSEGDLDNAYVLGMGANNPYSMGDAWEYGFFTNYIWEKMTDYNGNPYDLSFKTYCKQTNSINNFNPWIFRLIQQFPILESLF